MLKRGKFPLHEIANLTEIQAKILEILQIGHDNAIKREDLQKRLAIDERKMREIIESLRLEGFMILISPKPPFGYFLAQSKEEVDECIEYFRSRVRSEYHVYRSLKIASRKKQEHSFGQLPMFMD